MAPNVEPVTPEEWRDAILSTVPAPHRDTVGTSEEGVGQRPDLSNEDSLLRFSRPACIEPFDAIAAPLSRLPATVNTSASSNTKVVSLGRSSERLWGRIAAAFAVASAALHLVALTELPLALGLGMAAATVVCVGCASSLWRGPTPITWLAAGLMNVSMLGIHAYTMSAVDPDLAGMSFREHLLSHLRGDGWDLMHVASMLAAAEAAIATAALARHRGGRRRKTPPRTTPGAPGRPGV